MHGTHAVQRTCLPDRKQNKRHNHVGIHEMVIDGEVFDEILGLDDDVSKKFSERPMCLGVSHVGISPSSQHYDLPTSKKIKLCY